eukprot:gene12225-biopygen19935
MARAWRGHVLLPQGWLGRIFRKATSTENHARGGGEILVWSSHSPTFPDILPGPLSAPGYRVATGMHRCPSRGNDASCENCRRRYVPNKGRNRGMRPVGRG